MKLLNYQKHVHHPKADWVVFLHGAGGSILTWKYQVNSLKKHFNLLLLDLRDHGLSKNLTPSVETYSFDLVTEDIISVLRKEQVEKAHFVTLSFGSVLMQSIHQRHPNMVDRMVFIGGIFNANWMIRSFVHLARLFNIFLSYPSMYRLFSYLLMPKKRSQVARRVYQMQARKLSQKEYLKWIGLYSEFFTLLHTFHSQKISNEMMVVMGEDDYMFLPSAINFTSDRPSATLKQITAAGHICNIDKPKEVNSELLSFLDARSVPTERPQTTKMYGTN